MNMLEEGRGTHFDPDFLDVFTKIAKPIYERLSGNDEEPVEELKGIVSQYFEEEVSDMD
jgi:HD-GYP domain-containing protein (c-di-GMP phosphodiesterase class II)